MHTPYILQISQAFAILPMKISWQSNLSYSKIFGLHRSLVPKKVQDFYHSQKPTVNYFFSSCALFSACHAYVLWEYTYQSMSRERNKFPIPPRVGLQAKPVLDNVVDSER